MSEVILQKDSKFMILFSQYLVPGLEVTLLILCIAFITDFLLFLNLRGRIILKFIHLLNIQNIPDIDVNDFENYTYCQL